MVKISSETSAVQGGLLQESMDEADFVVPSAEGVRIPLDPGTVEKRLGDLLEFVESGITLKP